MEAGTDTSSAHFRGQWAFLSTRRYHHGNPRSVPASSQTPRREVTDSSNSQQVPSTPQYTFPRASTLRPCSANAIGTRTPTLPSQPVTVRVHSADASQHQNPAPHVFLSKINMSRGDELPPVSDFSIEGILAAIQPDVEGIIDDIAEIMGRSRLTLANEYDSHMPPQGEIRAASHPPLLPVEEASSSNERLAGDNVVIVGEDASLVEGSNAGSAAYGILERFGQMPRPRRQRTGGASSWAAGPAITQVRALSSPAVLPISTPVHETSTEDDTTTNVRTPRFLLKNGTSGRQSGRRASRTTNAVVSETYLHAGANGRPSASPPIVSSAGRHYPLYSYDESNLFELPGPVSGLRSFQSRFQNSRFVSELHSLALWLRREGSSSGSDRRQDAQARLRGILERHGGSVVDEEVVEREPEVREDAEMYD